MVDIALKILLHDRLRFIITVSGVAFAVTLVLVQVGLFLGLLDNASITIEKCNADLWVTSRNTANVDYGQPFTTPPPNAKRPWRPCNALRRPSPSPKSARRLMASCSTGTLIQARWLTSARGW